jgi:phytoene dehydrogenase-like protein
LSAASREDNLGKAGLEKGASACNASLSPQPNAAIEVFTPLYWYSFAQWVSSYTHQRPADYYAFKQQLQDAQLAQLYAALPQLQGHVVYKESATPLTIRDWASKSGGAMMGYVGLATKPNYYTGIPGLYFAGCDISGGVDAALMTGALSAGVMLNDRAFLTDYLNKIDAVRS